MKKVLIGPHNLDTFVQGDKLCLAQEHILSPGARDAARNRGISIVYGNAVGAENRSRGEKTACTATPESREELSRRIITLLRTEFDLTDPEAIRDITLKVLQRVEML